MKTIAFYLLFLVSMAFTVNAQSSTWTATITNSTTTGTGTGTCTGGVIDLHPPTGIFSMGPFDYTWYKIGDASFTSNDEDIYDLEPGQYSVRIYDNMCGYLRMTFLVLVDNYDFDLSHFQPGNCEQTPSKTIIGNGALLLTWNEDVSPAPMVTLSLPTGDVLIENGNFIGGLGPGTYYLNFSVGNCSFPVIQELCCCSVDDDFVLIEGAEGVCDHVTDGIPFDIDIIDVKGATEILGWIFPDAEISLTIASPGPNWSITWERQGDPNVSIPGTTFLENLLPGEYCYEYQDECHYEEDCIIIDNCGDLQIPVQDWTRSTCLNSSDGIVSFIVDFRNGIAKDFIVYNVNEDGTLGTTDNIEIGETNGVGRTLVTISNLPVGEVAFRVVTDQCEKDVIGSVPERLTDSRNEDRENCIHDIYCNGDFLYSRDAPIVDLPSEFCFVVRKRCTIRGSATQTYNIFDREKVHDLTHNDEDQTCSFLYICENGNEQTINGRIDWNYTTTCPKSNDLDVFATVHVTKVCKVTINDLDDTEISLPLGGTVDELATINEIYGDCGDCELVPSDPYYSGIRREYSWTNPAGLTETFDCCEKNFECRIVTKPSTIKTTNPLIQCVLESKSESVLLTNLGSGHTFSISNTQVDVIIEQMNSGSIVRASALGYQLTPSIYVLTTPNCKPIYVTVL